MPPQVILARVPLAALRAAKRPLGPVSECFIDVSFEVLPCAVFCAAPRDGALEALDVIPMVRPAPALSTSESQTGGIGQPTGI